MRIITPYKKTLAILIAVAFSWSMSAPVFASDATSTSFSTNNETDGTFGGVGTSTSFSSVATGGQTATGESTSTNFVVDAGAMYYDSFAPKSQNWRWYDDETNETPSTPLASENVAPTAVGTANIIKLRISIAETGGIGANNVKFALQYSTSSDFSTGAVTLDEISSCTGGSAWCYANGAGADNAVITTNVLSDSDTCSGSAGTGCGTHNESGTSTSAFTQSPNTVTEYEFTLVESTGANVNTVYFFRPVNNAAGTPVPLNGAATYPSLVTGGGTLSFTIGGLATSTVTAGITTDINTDSTLVPFGTLPINTDLAGAQRLTVSTNASQGYENYAYQQQGFVNEHADAITPVAGTNGSPVAWATGCPSIASGCYGYHTTESTLAGGSTRFAADDTYAQFSNNPDEVAYSVGPASGRNTDMVYRVKVNTTQESGSYTSGVVYIVVPTF
jgi:hypothetical protein